jgi:thioester reductase-like protein
MGTIGPHSVSGEINPNDMICYLAKVIKTCGLPSNARLPLNWVPVDLLSLAIAKIASNDDDQNTKCLVYHFQSTTPTVGECFPDAKEVSLNEWRKRVREETERKDHPCYAVRETLLGIEFESPGNGIVETVNTDKLHGMCFDYTEEMMLKVRAKLNNL